MIKKFLLSLFAVLMVMLPSVSATYDSAAKVQTVGPNLLTKNGISTTNVKFMVVAGNVDNSNYTTNKTITVSSNDLAYTGNDNEVASVVANEFGHIISGHASRGKVVNMLQSATNTSVQTNETATAIASSYKSLKEEKEADIIAVNLMVAAGYNPLASIVVLTKQTGTYWETIQGKPANAERAMNIFNYISYAYPDKLKAGYGCNEYRTFLAYANSVVDARTKKEIAKNTKEQEKSKKTSSSQIAKFKTRGGMSGWDAAYGLLNGVQ